MKLSILLVICLIASTIAVTPACVSASYCKGCSATTATECTSCYNSAGTIGPRFLATASCAGALDLITNCKIYNKSLTAKTTGTTSGDCMLCDDSTYFLREEEPSSATTLTITCNKVAQDTTTCTKIADCAQNRCKGKPYVAASRILAADEEDRVLVAAVVSVQVCMMCNAGKGAKADMSACDEASPIANCSQEYGNGTDRLCYTPATGFAVATDLKSAIAYTADVNCQILLDATQCGTCKDGYWWNTTECTLSAKLLGAAFLAVVALFIN